MAYNRVNASSPSSIVVALSGPQVIFLINSDMLVEAMSSAGPSSSEVGTLPYVIHPRGKHLATVVWLHALGDHGSKIKWICPTAPFQTISLSDCSQKENVASVETTSTSNPKVMGSSRFTAFRLINQEPLLRSWQKMASLSVLIVICSSLSLRSAQPKTGNNSLIGNSTSYTEG